MNDAGMYELLVKILRGVSFICVGGAVAIMFILIFAQTITGAKTIHSQLERLLRQTEKINGNLEKIAERLDKDEQQDSA